VGWEIWEEVGNGPDGEGRSVKQARSSELFGLFLEGFKPRFGLARCERAALGEGKGKGKGGKEGLPDHSIWSRLNSRAEQSRWADERVVESGRGYVSRVRRSSKDRQLLCLSCFHGRLCRGLWVVMMVFESYIIKGSQPPSYELTRTDISSLRMHN
jgi:hypothetical protein